MNKLKFRLLFLVGIIAILLIMLFSPYKLPYLGYYNKIFPHRINSIERLDKALQYFDGLELDLVYNENTNILDVNHPPAISINLSLENYLKHITKDNKPFLWLDIKNLNTTNAARILNRVEELATQFNYPKTLFLIETRYPESLSVFVMAGYKTSYYLPANLNALEKTQLEEKINYIASVLEKQPEIGISTAYKDYSIIAKYFPKKTKYIWALSSIYSFDFFQIRKILQDDSVEIVLTKFRTQKGNR